MKLLLLLVLVIGAHAIADLPPASSRGLRKVPAKQDVWIERNGIKILLASRLAGGVFSMQRNGQEYVQPLMGNGGSQQSALALDIPPGYSAEVCNPTEAGTVQDNGGRTSSEWLETAVNENQAFTRSKPANFKPPGTTVTNNRTGLSMQTCSPLITGVEISKQVKIVSVNRVNYRLTFTVPNTPVKRKFIQFEVLTGYMPKEFSKIYTMSQQPGRPVQEQQTAEYSYQPTTPVDQQPFALILSTANREHALGIKVIGWPRNNRSWERFPVPWYSANTALDGGFWPWDKGFYPQFVRPPKTSTGGLSKWNVVWQAKDDKNGLPDNQNYTFDIVLFLGSFDNVVRRLRLLTV